MLSNKLWGSITRVSFLFDNSSDGYQGDRTLDRNQKSAIPLRKLVHRAKNTAPI